MMIDREDNKAKRIRCILFIFIISKKPSFHCDYHLYQVYVLIDNIKAQQLHQFMFRMDLSSGSDSSDSEDENLDGHYKKVAYDGNISESQLEESQANPENSQSSKKNSEEVGKITNNKSSEPLQKTKAIKKNCQSAKMSRQRKKVYLQLLQQKAKQLKTQILSRKNNIGEMSSMILQKFHGSNLEKHAFLTKKVGLSKKLLALAQEIQQLKKTYEEDVISTLQMQQIKTPDSSNPCGQDRPQIKCKSRKRKVDSNKNANNKKELQAKIGEKEDSLQLAINAYMYEFGAKGCLRTDVIQRAKMEWLDNIKSSSIVTPELVESVQKMQALLYRLEQRCKKLDYNLRGLRDRVKSKYVVQFLLDRQFFIHKSADTIYKHSQMGFNNT